MGNPISLEKLARDVQYLMDRQAILDVIMTHARGHAKPQAAASNGEANQPGRDRVGGRMSFIRVETAQAGSAGLQCSSDPDIEMTCARSEAHRS